MKSYDAYFFDWDGTIADTVRLSLQIVEAHCHKYGLTTAPEQLAQYLSDWTAAVRFGLPPDELDTFNYELKVKFAQQMTNPPLHADVVELLLALKSKGKQLALITSSMREVITAASNHHHVAALFTTIITAHDVHKPKPDPEGVLAALQACNVDVSRALMLGDTISDIMAAQNAGVDSLLFYPPNHAGVYNLAQLQQAGPSYTVGSWRELLNEVENL